MEKSHQIYSGGAFRSAILVMDSVFSVLDIFRHNTGTNTENWII